MNLMGLFRSPQNELEKGGKPVPEEDAGIRTTCPHCGVQLPLSELQDNQQVCTACGYHFRIGSDRIGYLTDEESFQELYGDMMSRDILDFPGYDQKLRNAKLASREKEGVVCGAARVGGEPCALFVMDPNFMIGSMGTVWARRSPACSSTPPSTPCRWWALPFPAGPHAGGHPLFDADGQDQRRPAPAL